MREFPKAVDLVLLGTKPALLQIPTRHRCEAARRFAYHAGSACPERLSILRKLCSGCLGRGLRERAHAFT
eukprot:11495580-Alexandrium_andersonii.AAC.1